MARYWRELAWPDFQHMEPAHSVAILPVAAVEQHGPPLPAGVDDFISEGIIHAAMTLMADSARLLATCPLVEGPIPRPRR